MRVVKAALLGVTLAAAAAAPSHAAFVPTSSSFIQVTQPSNILFTFEGFSASDTDTMSLVMGTTAILINQHTMVGTTFTTGPFTAGTYPLKLVDSTTGATWFSNPASNSDGKAHLMSDTTYSDFNLGATAPVAAAAYYGWEDRAFPGADADYNDLVFAVTVQAVPEPASLAVIGLGLVGAGLVRRRTNRAG